MIVNPNTLTNHFQKFLEQHGLPKIRFHELRHSCASLLIACGVNMKEIQEWLGHSAISTTVNNQYGHTKLKFEFKQSNQCESKSQNLLMESRFFCIKQTFTAFVHCLENKLT